MATDFSELTEVPGAGATAEQLEMLRTRYRLAADHAAGKDVLEAACGSGIGLGLLARAARRVVGGDYTMPLLRRAAAHYGNRIPLIRFDAQRLPFRGGSFDVVLLYEAIYYLPDAGRFVAEARRVLRPGGMLLICSANREWSEFHPSPHAVRYYSAGELRNLLERHGFRPELRAAFDVARRGPAGSAVAWLRRAASSLGLIPKTLAGRARLKRLFYGALTPIPPELDGSGSASQPAPVPLGPVSGHKVLYAVCFRD